MEERYIRTIQKARGKFLTFRQDEVVQSDGRKTIRDMVLHPGAVAVLAVTAEEEILLVRQFRYPAGEILYEIPAGKLESGEEPLTAAQRELAEETGYAANEWKKINSFYTAPGFTNEMIHLYLAEQLTCAEVHPDPDEVIEYEKMPLTQVYEKTKNGEIKDAKSIIAILWLMNKRAERLKDWLAMC